MITALVFLYECISLIEVNAKIGSVSSQWLFLAVPDCIMKVGREPFRAKVVRPVSYGRPFRLRIKHLLQDVTKFFLYSMVNR